MAERDPAKATGWPPPVSGGWRRRAELVIVLALAALIVAGGALLWHRYSANAPLEIAFANEQSRITVYVGGAVNKPGIYRFTTGATVADAVNAAGDFAPDADSNAIDPEQLLKRDEGLLIPRTGESPQRVNINTADVWLLEALPGIGEITAQKIIEYRTANGPFRSPEELCDLKLVSASTFNKIKDLITLGP